MTRLWWCGILIAAPLLMAADQGELAALISESARVRGLSPVALQSVYDDQLGRFTEPGWLELETRLRTWVESHLPANVAMLETDSADLEATLVSELKRAGLFRSERTAEAAGYVSLLKVSRPAGYPNALIVQSGVSVPCGSDVSYNLYHFTPNGRKRLLEASGTGKWGSQLFDTRLSAPDGSGVRLLYLSWDGVQCESIWHSLEYRVFRLSREADPPVEVLSGKHSFVRDAGVKVKIAPDELLLELTAEAMEGGFWRTYVLHYRFGADGAERIDPVALQPQDFVHEWLLRPWSEMQSRSAPSLAKWHELLHADSVFGGYEFVQPCEDRPGFTEIGVSMPPRSVCFLVEDRGHHQFKMVDASYDRPVGCPGDSKPFYDDRPSVFKKR